MSSIASGGIEDDDYPEIRPPSTTSDPDWPTTQEDINGTTQEDINGATEDEIYERAGRNIISLLSFLGCLAFAIIRWTRRPTPYEYQEYKFTSTPTNTPTMIQPTISIQPSAPPTVSASPTLQCDSRFQLTLITDRYGEETFWDVTDNNGNEVTSGGPYNVLDRYVVSECLVYGLYTFTIYDMANDGLCCEYGIGSYKLSLGGVDFACGGAFESSDTVSFAVPLQLDPRFPDISSKTPYVVNILYIPVYT